MKILSKYLVVLSTFLGFFSTAHADYFMPYVMKENISRELHACKYTFKFDDFGVRIHDDIYKIVIDALRDQPSYWNEYFGHKWLDTKKATAYIQDHPEITQKITELASKRRQVAACALNVASFANPTSEQNLLETVKGAESLVRLYQRHFRIRYTPAEFEKAVFDTATLLKLARPASFNKGHEYIKDIIFAQHLGLRYRANLGEEKIFSHLVRIAMGNKYTDQQFLDKYRDISKSMQTIGEWLEEKSNIILFPIFVLLFGMPC